MPLSRAENERDLIRRPSLSALTERPRITTLVKPRSKETGILPAQSKSKETGISHSEFKSHQHIDLDWFDNSDSQPTTGSDPKYQYHQHFGLDWFGDTYALTNKREATTASVKQHEHHLQLNYPAAFDKTLTLPSISAENVDIKQKPSHPLKPHLHYHPDVFEGLTVGPKNVELTTKATEEVREKFSLSVGDVWHWILDDKTTASRAKAPAETTPFNVRKYLLTFLLI